MKTKNVSRLLHAALAGALFVAFAATGAPARADSPAADPAGSPGVRVLRSDSRGMTVEYRPTFSIRRIAPRGEEFTRYRFDGEVAGLLGETAGAPDLRFRRFPIALPAESGNTVRVIAADYEDVQGVVYMPVPRYGASSGIPEAAEYRIDPKYYGNNQFLPENPVLLAQGHVVGDAILGTLKIFPLQYNPAVRTLRAYSRIVVDVIYGSSTVASRKNRDDLSGFGLLNYSTAQGWSLSRGLSRVAAPASSILSSGPWYRLTVGVEGIYKLDAALLGNAGINLSQVDPRTMKIYGNGGEELSEDITAPRATDLVENAVYVKEEGDGKFNASDYLLFYGRGPGGWKYDPSARRLSHHIHHYADVNYYWLTFGGAQGKRMQAQPSLTTAATAAPAQFIDGVFVEQEISNLLLSGKDWFGQQLAAESPSFTYINLLPGLVAQGSISYRYALAAHSDNYSTFTVSENGTVIGSHTIGPNYGYTYAQESTFDAAGTSSLSSNTSQLNISFASPSVGAQGWIDWIEILYPRAFSGVNEMLRFRSPDGNAVNEYQLLQFASAPLVFNVTAPADVKLITGLTPSMAFRASETAGRVSEYCATGPSAYKTPAAIQKIQNEDLRGYASGADFIIVTSEEFRSQADRLKAYREQPAHGNLKTYVADVAQIYNEFSGGLPDVAAIRDFLKYAYDQWTPRPRFVLFFGGGSYDYKGILGSRSSFVPTWQSRESLDEVDSYSTDDFFVKFGSGDGVSMIGGRISSRTLAEATTVVDKIARYETQSVQDAWKMRITYVADDAWTTEGGEIGDGTIHSDDAETLAQNFTPNEFEKKKIYIAEYPTVWNAQGRRKPGGYQAIIDQINQGTLIMNFAGHGNPTQWAHENIFNVATSISPLINADKLTMFLLATCNFSQFDDPKRATGSELLVNKPDGAAIAVISATRKVYQSANAELSQGTYARMFFRDIHGRLVVRRPAEALYLYKNAGGNSSNDQKYFFMGDPTLFLQYPGGYASIDHINGAPVDSVQGVPRVSPILLRSLSQVSLAGTIRDAQNSVDQNFTARLILTVNDATHNQVIVNFYPGYDWTYVATGGMIYRGEVSVTGGKFNASFVVPKDITYADSVSVARLSVYAYGSSDCAGYTSKIRIGGTDSSAVNSQKGPTIGLYLQNHSFRQGDVVGGSPTLIVDLADSSGINTSVSGVGHRIEAWVNNAAQSKDLTEYYASTLDDFRRGTIQYPLEGLPPGANTLRVRAWDSFNNSAVAETFFTVVSDEKLAITDVFNYPNPFPGSTQFTFRQNQTGTIHVVVKIYSLAGRVLNSLETSSTGELFVRLPWDGRDREGSPLANGVYLYKVVAQTADGRFSSEALGKLSIVR